MSEEKTSTEVAAAAVAARRRAKKTGALPPPLPETPNLPEPIAETPVQGRSNGPVAVASSLIAEFTAQEPTGLTTAYMGGGGQPLVQPTSNMYGITPRADNYVLAEFDASESMVPVGAKQPVSRLLWRKGWRVRKDFYAEVCKRRSAADQEAARVSPAALPAGVTDPPAEFVAEPQASSPGAPA